MHPLSLILIWACAGNVSALPTVDPDPQAIGCDRHHWGYSDPVLDFRTLSDCNTAGSLIVRQPPHVYATWRCVDDPKKETLFDDDPKPWFFTRLWNYLFG